ncbi:hypothetical protein RVF83_14655 [Gordonia rubripertincta]|uniref:Anti-sigma-E factor RseA n=2 Tax=Gordonia rubripertincta TaxID=36822 RepID=A0AAW4G2B7_GORRU|nr:hypothetical protein [Gordonia rubripertincta]MBM7277611.1 hypothetical protein [Gordonia rubripertincta]MDG6780079.1 hypothetical protein [Gordonia rubripertincta]NKY65227.1 hypothetical protein [Gordonia rubripertincta]QMU20260.1 hypothetical protein H3V45_19845 [Gordonia rubripertincta]GAB84624.1 hypothetical protein GORBP_043_00060 [Gordonia rubripertincta NBRC 101908]
MMNGDRGRPTRGGGIEPPTPNLRRRRSSWSTDSWTPAPSSFLPNRGYRAPGTAGGRRFAPTEHLAPEAVAAFVDGELGMSAHARAAHHLALCPECVAAVDAQSLARTRLRESGQVSVPASLLGALSQIPTREIDLGSDTPTDGIPGARDAMRPPANPLMRDTGRGRNFRRRGR